MTFQVQRISRDESPFEVTDVSVGEACGRGGSAARCRNATIRRFINGWNERSAPLTWTKPRQHPPQTRA